MRKIEVSVVLAFFTLSSPLSVAGQGHTVIAWGDNSSGQTNAPLYLTNAVAVAGGAQHSLALKADGALVGWGDDSWGQISVPAAATNVTAIAAGYFHNLVLREDGTVFGWGRNQEGQVTIPDEVTNVIRIAAGPHSSLALRADGTLVAWGQNQYGQTNTTAEQGFTEIDCGYHGLGLRGNGSVAGWGYDFWGQADGGSAGSNLVSIAAGVLHSMAVKEDGSVVAWGRGLEGQTNVPPTLTNAVAVAGGLEHGLALTTDGRVVAWGRSLHGETNVPANLRNVVAIAAGVSHNLALTTDLPVYPPPDPEVDRIPRLSLTVETNGPFELQYREDLDSGTDWTALESMWLSNSVNLFNDESGIRVSSRFYQLVSSNSASELAIEIVPRLTLRADVGEEYRLEYRHLSGPTNLWSLLEIVTITNNPQFYFDLSGIGQPTRIYRLSFVTEQ
jgi:hypothetical protein